MQRHESRAEYRRRMYRVLEYIDRHLDQPLDLRILAEVACFSPFHFHRLFNAWMGMTLGEYLRKRRIEYGALKLIAQPQLSILQVAVSVGFGSGEAFARAFRKRYGNPPTEWRERARLSRVQQDSNLDQVNSNLDQIFDHRLADTGFSLTAEDYPAMNVLLEDFPIKRIAYQRYTGPYGPGVGEFWARTFWPWARTQGLQHQTMYGISHDNPTVTEPSQCRYDACVELPDGVNKAANADITELPGGRYAVYRFKGSAMNISQAWNDLMCGWLPDSGLQLDDRPCLERYPAKMSIDDETGNFECDLCIPVVELGQSG